jgi:hypothetical protein
MRFEGKNSRVIDLRYKQSEIAYPSPHINHRPANVDFETMALVKAIEESFLYAPDVHGAADAERIPAAP